MWMLAAIGRWIAGGGASGLVGQWTDLQAKKLEAANDHERIELEREQHRLEAMIATGQQAVADRWSATSIGRYLIVVPYGIWWTAIFFVSTFNLDLVVEAIPPAIQSQADWLIPAIIVGDLGQSVAKRFGR